MHGAEVAANKYIQERFVPKLVSAGIVVAVDIVRRPDDESPQGAAIVKKADEIDAACIILCPHEQDFGSEVSIPGAPSFLSARTLLSVQKAAQSRAWMDTMLLQKSMLSPEPATFVPSSEDMS